jgi:hypothetical protein
MTPSDVIAAGAAGYTELKLFPAQQAGGIGMLKALGGPFPHIRFCPTGGITAATAPEFLALPNVVCVGGSWLTPPTRWQPAIGAASRRLPTPHRSWARRARAERKASASGCPRHGWQAAVPAMPRERCTVSGDADRTRGKGESQRLRKSSARRHRWRARRLPCLKTDRFHAPLPCRCR